jgi:hypothetical protein
MRVTGLLIQRGSLNCHSELLQCLWCVLNENLLTEVSPFLFYRLRRAKRDSLIYVLRISFKILWFLQIFIRVPQKLQTVYLKICIRYSRNLKLKSLVIFVEGPIVLTKVVGRNSTYILYSHKFLVIRRVFEIIKHDSSLQSCIKDTFLTFVKFLDHFAGWSNDDSLFSIVRLFWRFGGIHFLHHHGNWGSDGIFYILVDLLL